MAHLVAYGGERVNKIQDRSTDRKMFIEIANRHDPRSGPTHVGLILPLACLSPRHNTFLKNIAKI